MTPNMAVYRDRSEAYLDRLYAEAWCELNYARTAACPSGMWLISVCRKDTEEDVTNDLDETSPGFMGAFSNLMGKIESEGIIGSFEVVS